MKKTKIEAKTGTLQLHFVFDRQTGIAKFGSRPVLYTIDSTAPLPEEIYKIMLGLDHKFRLDQDLKTDTDFEKLKFSSAEKKALSFISSFYPSNLL